MDKNAGKTEQSVPNLPTTSSGRKIIFIVNNQAQSPLSSSATLPKFVRVIRPTTSQDANLAKPQLHQQAKLTANLAKPQLHQQAKLTANLAKPQLHQQAKLTANLAKPQLHQQAKLTANHAKPQSCQQAELTANFAKPQSRQQVELTTREGEDVEYNLCMSDANLAKPQSHQQAKLPANRGKPQSCQQAELTANLAKPQSRQQAELTTTADEEEDVEYNLFMAENGVGEESGDVHEKTKNDNGSKEGQANKGKNTGAITKAFWKKKVNLPEFPDVPDTTELMLYFLSQDKQWNALRDQSTRNNEVYSTVALKMESVGFKIHENHAMATEIVDNKWKNLRRKYREHNQKISDSGGNGDIKEPPYYDTMSRLIGGDHDIKPVDTLDSLNDSVEEKKTQEEKSGQEGNSNKPPSLIEHSKKSSKPSPVKRRKLDQVMDEVRIGREENNKNFQELISVVKERQATTTQIMKENSANFAALVRHITNSASGNNAAGDD